MRYTYLGAVGTGVSRGDTGLSIAFLFSLAIFIRDKKKEPPAADGCVTVGVGLGDCGVGWGLVLCVECCVVVS